MQVCTPGDVLREELQARGWTQSDLADIIGRPVGLVNRIVMGKRGISARTALELAAAFGTTPDLWLNLENAYRLARTR